MTFDPNWNFWEQFRPTWVSLQRHYTDRGIDLPKLGVASSQHYRLFSLAPGFRVSASNGLSWTNLQLEFRGEFRDLNFERLREERELALEKCLGPGLEWVKCEGRQKNYMRLRQEDQQRFGDQTDWPERQVWFSTRLPDWIACLRPLVRSES